MATAGKAKTKLVNGQRVNVGTNQPVTNSSGGGLTNNLPGGSVKFDMGGMPIEYSSPKDFVGKQFNTPAEAEAFFNAGGTAQEAMQQRKGNIAPTRTSPAQTITSPSASPQKQETQQEGQMAQGLLTYDPNVNPSVVDLLNSVGQASDPASRNQLAGQLGIGNYTGTAAQNQELARKFTDMYNAKGKTAPPESPSQFMQEYQTYQEENKQPQPFDELQQAFWGTYQQMNPIEKYLFDGISELLAPTRTKETLRELYEEELGKEGVMGLKTELADINRIMDGTEDDIRNEVQATNGFATESQVQALTAARNKTLLKKAQYLADLIDAKEEYVDRIVALTKADREQADKDIDRKLGISEMLLSFTDKLNSRARENYQDLIKNIGYDGLVSNITSPYEMNAVAASLGMSPSTLMRLSSVKTTDQRKMELDTLQHQLSVDTFEEDKRQFNLSYALEKNKLAQQEAAASVISPYTIEKTTRALSFVDDLRSDISNFTVGLGSLSSGIPGSPAADFKARVSALESAISFGELQEMRDASKTGGALGSIAIKELELLGSSLGALSTSQSPAQFGKSLDKVEQNLYRWNAIKLAAAKGFDYKSANNSGWSDAEIYNFLISK